MSPCHPLTLSPPHTVSPDTSSPDEKCSSSRSALITTLRPTRRLAGRCAPLPTTLTPVLILSGSSLFGVVRSSPWPSRTPAPITTFLSTITRSSTAPGPIQVSFITTLSRTIAPGETYTPGESTERSTRPRTIAPLQTMLCSTRDCGPNLAGGRSSLRVCTTHRGSYSLSVLAGSSRSMLVSQYD